MRKSAHITEKTLFVRLLSSSSCWRLCERALRDDPIHTHYSFNFNPLKSMTFQKIIPKSCQSASLCSALKRIFFRKCFSSCSIVTLHSQYLFCLSLLHTYWHTHTHTALGPAYLRCLMVKQSRPAEQTELLRETIDVET